MASTASASTTSSRLVHPGEVLLEEFLRSMGISQYRLALAIGVPESRINAIAVPFLRPQRRLLAEDAGQP
ncbi:MAG: transcriptional regulator [Cyanobacteriota bacterium]|jgi:addiction module HigA family antidote